MFPLEQSNPGRGVTVYEGHRAKVFSVAFSPDGNSLVSGSWDKTIRIWDTRTSSPIGRPINGNSYVSSVSYSPTGGMIASGSFDNKVRLWDTSTGQQMGEPLEGHEAKVSSVVFSPCGDRIASCSTDCTVRIWSTQSRSSISRLFVGQTGYVYSAMFSTGGARVTSGSSDGTIYLWDIERQKQIIGPLGGHTLPVQSVAFSPDGNQIISGSYDRTLRLWDTRIGRAIGEPYEGHAGLVRSVMFSPNSVCVASGSDDKTVRIWDLRNGRQAREPYKEHTGGVSSIAFSPCGGRVASASHDQTIMLQNISSSNSEVVRGSYAVVEGGAGSFNGGGSQPINRHMPIQEMFSLLSQHGCVNLASQMDTNQGTALLVSGGGFGDIWRGELYNRDRVAIKILRSSAIEQCDYKILKRATREIYCWSKMKHENIHQLMGVILFKGQSLGMVSEWMENGNLHEYLRKKPGADRFQLSTEVASGLAHIHSYKMVHGDVKAFNVLISSEGVAKLTDFGLSSIPGSSLPFSATTSQAGSIRWTSPEQILEGLLQSKPSDVYALSMTMLEIFTGAIPYYSECQRDYQVLLAVQQGILPTRPINYLKEDERGDRMWSLLVRCWDKNPNYRPSAEQVVNYLQYILKLPNIASSTNTHRH